MSSVVSSNIRTADGSSIGYFASQAYFVCTTAGYLANKVATSSLDDPFTFTNTSLEEGLTIYVKFTCSDQILTGRTLKIQDSDALEIRKCSTPDAQFDVDYDLDSVIGWQAGAVVSFTLMVENNTKYWALNAGSYTPVKKSYDVPAADISIVTATNATVSIAPPAFITSDADAVKLITRMSFSNTASAFDSLSHHYIFHRLDTAVSLGTAFPRYIDLLNPNIGAYFAFNLGRLEINIIDNSGSSTLAAVDSKLTLYFT